MDKQTLRLVFIHALVLLVFWTGTSATALWLAAIFFCWRALALTLCYHRYFSHRSFKTSRTFQFILALAGSICMQRGALWWAANHRKHHQYSDLPEDPHSPVAHGFWHGHMGWAMALDSFKTDYSRVRDFDIFPELKKLNEKSDLIHALFALGLFVMGELLRWLTPDMGTNGFQFVVWGYLISGLLHLHTVFLVNSYAHLYGSRPYAFPTREGRDNSHNVGWLAVLTFGEGWHYNHHCFPSSARLGLRWWELDIGWWVVKLWEKLGLIWDVKYPTHETIKALKAN